MTADCFNADPYKLTHRKGARYSHLTALAVTSSGVAMGTEPAYTEASKSQSFRIVPVKYSSLAPLVEGKAVNLLMSLPEGLDTRRRSRKPPPIPVVIVPGAVLGVPNRSLLVAVIGRGSAVITPTGKAGIANLVLAGIPQRLARALMSEIRHVFLGV